MEEEAANVYVGSLPPSVTPEILRAAFIPFGSLVDVHIPIEAGTGQSKGFGFVLFELAEDAAEAIDNMHNSIIHDQRIRVRNAHKRSKVVRGRAVWFAGEEGAGEEAGGGDRAGAGTAGSEDDG